MATPLVAQWIRSKAFPLVEDLTSFVNAVSNYRYPGDMYTPERERAQIARKREVRLGVAAGFIHGCSEDFTVEVRRPWCPVRGPARQAEVSMLSEK